MSVNPAQKMTLEALRSEAAAAFALAPEPKLKYGLNMFFTAKEAELNFGPVGDANAAKSAAHVRAPEGVRVLTIAEALADNELRFFAFPALITDERAAKIATWHQANAGVGTLVVVPPNFSAKDPIRIDLDLADERRVENAIVVVGEGSRITVVEHLRSSGERDAALPQRLRSSVTDIVAMPSSKVTHISLQDFGPNVTDLSLKRARVQQDASVTWIECVFGGAFAQSIVSTDLLEDGAATGSKTMFFGNGNQRFDLSQKVRHAASNTHSQLSTRGALADTAKTIYRGLVRIEKGTRKCTGYQKEDTLLLGEKAEIDAVPNLEIESEDVRCGHGASVGRLNKESLFYLMSRGLDEATARTFLVNGFFAPIVEEMRAAGLEDRVQCIIDERIAPAAK